MAFNGLRIALYAALWLFATILLGMSGARVAYTEKLSHPDTLHNGVHYYDPIIIEIIVTSILAWWWAVMMIVILALTAASSFIAWALESLGVFILWVMYLVGAAIVTHFWHGNGRCWHFLGQCKLLTAIIGFSWIIWVVTFALLAASAFSYIQGEGEERPAFRRRPKAEEAGVAPGAETREAGAGQPAATV